jgi:glucose/arabinose dehydrogenase
MSIVAAGLKEPTFVTSDLVSDRLYVLERRGVVRVVDGILQPEPLLDLSDRVSSEGEQGLLGMAFHPFFATNRYVYMLFTARDDALTLARYEVQADSPLRADADSEHVLLAVPKQTPNHNGGMLTFGPDGYLYVGVGDDGVGENAQDLGSMLGKILRIDVDAGSSYAIPAGNPFLDLAGARTEIGAYGLRNPWRFGFDPLTNDLWIADVGDTEWEEVNRQSGPVQAVRITVGLSKKETTVSAGRAVSDPA